MKEAVGFPAADNDKCHEAGMALGCSADVDEVVSNIERVCSREAAQLRAFSARLAIGISPALRHGSLVSSRRP